MKTRDAECWLREGSAKENPIIIEGLFRETTRNGKRTLRIVLLALTRNLLMVASSHGFGSSTQKPTENCSTVLEIRSLHPIESLKLSLFKKTERRTLKLRFHNKYDRYFELDKSLGTDHLWSIWCKNVIQLRYQTSGRKKPKKSLDKSTTYDLDIFNEQWKSHEFIWNDKYLYLGSKRELEDNSRPLPVPGLGPPEDLKLIHLKSQYFGCWDQAEHWVQCESANYINE